MDNAQRSKRSLFGGQRRRSQVALEEAAARPQTRSGREVAWSQSEVKTAQLVQAIKETRYVGCVAAAACCASAVLVVPPFINVMKVDYENNFQVNYFRIEEKYLSKE